MSLQVPIKPLALIGCAGSGRSAIIYHLTCRMPNKFERVITHTSRPKRQCEKDCFHFYFVEESQIKDNAEKFVTITKSRNGNYYGLAESQVERVMANNKIPIFRMTLDAYKANIKHSQNGKVFLYKDHIQCNALYINVPDLNELANRLKHSPFCEAECCSKIEIAKREQAEAQKFFMKQDHIYSSDIDETIVHIKSRLFELY